MSAGCGAGFGAGFGAAFDALVIGAGPAGSCAAILLADAGWRVALVEKQDYPRRKVCGECISAASLSIFERLGVRQALAPFAGRPLRQMALVCGTRILRAPLPAHADGSNPWGLAIGREHLDALLLERARERGVTVFQPWQADGLAGTPGDFACRLRRVGEHEERLLAARLVIDAHGAWEPPLREDGGGHARPARPQLSSDLFAFKANFADTALEPGLLPVLSFPGGYGGLVVADGARATFAFCLRRDALARARRAFPGARPAEAAQCWVRRHAGAADALLGPGAQVGAWLGAGPIRPGIHLGKRGENMFRIGNAAGEAHPIIGEGINMALQSAVLLVAALLRHRGQGAAAHARLHAAYAEAWRRQFGARIRMSALYAQLAMRPQLFGGLLPSLARHPALLTRLARWCGKVAPAPACPE
jgi:2-polyprenyl-6-methoxyphenol hydroxylase-like FAD-dependent oxidoreductase